MNISLIHTETDPWALGIRNVSAMLKRGGHRTRLIIMGPSEQCYSPGACDALRELVRDSDIIGISSFSRGSDKAVQIADHLRPLKKFMVWGGVHATLNPEECAKYVDLVCRGEGEEMMLELANRLASGKDWHDINGGVYERNGSVIANPLRSLIDDLDALPVTDYSFENEYHLGPDGFRKVSNFSNITEPILFIGSRGCAYHCTYCSNAKLKKIFAGSGRYLRKMSVKRYIEHAAEVRKAFPKNQCFYFIDEDFFQRSVQELSEFGELYQQKIGLPFESLASPLQISDEKMAILARAGFWRIRMGVESGSERTKREIYNRAMPNEAVMRAAATITKYRIVPYYFLIVSNPYEENEDLVSTVNLLRALPTPYFLQTFNLVFFPGSELYERAMRDALITGKQDSGYRLDTRGGLKHSGHAWKKKNLYLNGLIYLMEGKSTPRRLGLVPRLMVPAVMKGACINFNDNYPAIVKGLIALKGGMLFLRKIVARVLTRMIGDPRAIYDFKRYVRRKLTRA
jgi:anaerobic magnesium-protoporphyrin IX monomethyl ester cyclase